MKWIRENIEMSPSFSPYFEQIEVIEGCISSNPALCVETCKSLIEGICKTILNNLNVEFSNQTTFQGLVQKTIGSILNEDDNFKTDLSELGGRIASVANKLGEIRNHRAGFATHGLDVLNPRLTETVSVFAYKVADTIGGFILNCYINNRVKKPDHRIHYEDCAVFNEYFDEINPIMLGGIILSASEALFKQDYEAYKESYFDYLNNLENEEFENEI
jgi:hypothetical protein